MTSAWTVTLEEPRADAVARDSVAPPPTRLRRRLVIVDGAALLAAWMLGAWISVRPTTFSVRTAAMALTVVAVSLAAIAAQRLYLARVCWLRTEELRRLGRIGAIGAATMYVLGDLFGRDPSLVGALVGGMLAFTFLAAGRSAYREWLKLARARGHHQRPIVVVGTNGEGAELARLVLDHPELGFELVGAVGATPGEEWPTDVAVVAEAAETVGAVVDAGASGVLVATSAFTPDAMHRMTRELLAAGVHVQISSGLRRIDHRRLRAVPLARESIYYVEQVSLTRWQLAAKRAIDLVFGSLLILLTLPVLAVAAIAIKIEDRGPVFFRQERVGRGGRTFQVLKLRTMDPDAEDRLIDLVGHNERNGPLFKLAADPRRTRTGQMLERWSLDELPQLWNVLTGEMSLVGPRPALPSEVAEFDDELRGRDAVAPGVTGLWQVEARDNPSFDAYRRFDLFYIENWSVSLDLAILFGTVPVVLSRVFRGKRTPNPA